MKYKIISNKKIEIQEKFRENFLKYYNKTDKNYD